MMGVIVLSSNYLVQFPVNYYGMGEILTYGAFSYPIAFLITDLTNRSFGKLVAQKIVYFGFLLGIGFTIIFSTDFFILIFLFCLCLTKTLKEPPCVEISFTSKIDN